MSIYKREINLLNQIDSWLSEDSTSVVTFMCHCLCESKVEVFNSTREARQWLEKHRNHYEPLIDIRLEGIHSRHRAEQADSPTRAGGFSAGANERSTVLEKIHKLYRLAENTTFPEEACTAKRKIDKLKELLNLA